MVYIVLISILVYGWIYYNANATYKLIYQAIYAIHDYNISNIRKVSINEALMNYDDMRYTFGYVFLRPWLTSAIKPQYQELLEPFYEES